MNTKCEWRWLLVVGSVLALCACGGGGGGSSGGGSSSQLRGLNDTGITTCGDYAYPAGTNNNHLDCATVGATQTTAGTDADGDPVPAGQDAVYGRDAVHATNDPADGPGGFSYTKLDATGAALPNTASSWVCVKDNVTKLTWEVKNTTAGLHDVNSVYTWYDANSATNGGNAGTQNGGTCTASDCDTSGFVTAVNAEHLCGFGDWRLPTNAELLSLINYGVASGAIVSPQIGPTFVTLAYWSSVTDASDVSRALDVISGMNISNKSDIRAVRVVRD